VRIVCLVATIAAIALATSSAFAGEVDLPRYPSISPDGERIVFSWHGDLWMVPADGGEAHRLTNHAGLDTRSTWSPDGSTIAFESNRSGYWNLHVMDADGSDMRQVTQEDASCSLAGFSADGLSLTFTSSREGDVYREPRPYRVSVAGSPISRVHGAHGRFPRENPFRKGELLFTRGGSSWSRRHYRGPANRDVWVHTDGVFQRLTSWEGNDGRARWLDTRRMVYMSDRELDTVNLWAMEAGGLREETASRLTSFEGRDVQSFDVAAKSGRIVLHVWDKLYVIDDVQSPRLRPLAITAPGDRADPTFVVDASSKVREARLSPDGKVLATVAYGTVFVRALDDDSPTRRVTQGIARAKDIAWSADGMRLFFVSDENGTDSIYAASVATTRSEVLEAFEKATAPPEPPEEETEEAAETEPAGTTEETENDETEPGDESEAAPEEEPAADDGSEKPAEPAEDAKEEEEDVPGPERWQDPLTFTIEPVLAVGTNDRQPQPSPDGKWLAFRRELGGLCVLDLKPDDPDARDVTDISAGWNLGSFRWSPDSQHMAWHREDRDFNSDIWITSFADGEWTDAVNVSRHPDDDVNPRWSEDGRMLAFASERHDEEFDVYVVFLDRDLEAMTPQERNDYFDERKKAAKKRKPLPHVQKKPHVEKKSKDDDDKDGKKGKAKDSKKEKPIELELDDAYMRVRRVTTARGNEASLELTPAGDRIVY
jgi:tricorn protease